MMPAEIDMPNPEDTGSPAATSRAPLRTWDFMETLFVSLIAYGVYTLTAGLALTLMPAMPDWTTTLSSVQFQVLGAAYIVASPLTIAVLWIAVQMAGRDFVEYLALNWPSPGELLRALAIMAMILFAESLAGYAIGEKQTVMNSFAGARQSGGFLVLLIGGCVAAPIMEEFVVRGFMLRGWSQSFLGPAGAIVLTSALWGMIHTQYDWFGRFCIFVMGLALGHFRWRANSTWLAVMVHSSINIFLFFAISL